MATGEGPGTEGGATGESAEGFGGNISGPDTNGNGSYAEEVSNVISATMTQAKTQSLSQQAENFDPMGSSHIGQFGYYGGVDASGQPTGTQPTHSTMRHTLVGDAMRAKDQTITGTGTNFTDAQYRDKGWVPGKALTYTDEQGKTQLATLEAHENRMELSELEALRQQAYAAKNAQPGIDTPFGKMTAESVAKAAFGMISPAAGLGGMFTGLLDSIGLPNVGPFMSEDDRNWDDARWGDNYNPNKSSTPYTIDDQGNLTVSITGGANPPTSPAGGEQITVAAPPGAPDQRVTQFKALYPAEWTETLTDEEIIAMVENPDQLRYWLSWRQT